jgi:hypothetical protein
MDSDCGNVLPAPSRIAICYFKAALLLPLKHHAHCRQAIQTSCQWRLSHCFMTMCASNSGQCAHCFEAMQTLSPNNRWHCIRTGLNTHATRLKSMQSLLIRAMPGSALVMSLKQWTAIAGYCLQANGPPSQTIAPDDKGCTWGPLTWDVMGRRHIPLPGQAMGRDLTALPRETPGRHYEPLIPTAIGACFPSLNRVTMKHPCGPMF